MKNIIVLALVILFSSTLLNSQSWQRDEPVTEPPLQVFHSNYALNLPTAETLKQGEFLYGIGHRFRLPVSSGFSDLFGLDGGVVNRLNLGYAVTDDIFLNLGRSNQGGQFDFEVKYKTLELKNETLPVLISLLGGVAYTSKPVPDIEETSRLFTYYGTAIVNAAVTKKFALGINPTYIYNANVQCECAENTFLVGSYAQYYIDDMWSIIAEANQTITGWRDFYNSYAVGFELETGGHFFKFSVSNNTLLNLSQYGAGAQSAFLGSADNNNLHFGFMITRIL